MYESHHKLWGQEATEAFVYDGERIYDLEVSNLWHTLYSWPWINPTGLKSLPPFEGPGAFVVEMLYIMWEGVPEYTAWVEHDDRVGRSVPPGKYLTGDILEVRKLEVLAL